MRTIVYILLMIIFEANGKTKFRGLKSIQEGSISLVRTREYNLFPGVTSHHFFNLTLEMRKELCINALNYSRFLLDEVPTLSYVPQARLYKLRIDETAIEVDVLVRCPTLPQLYVAGDLKIFVGEPEYSSFDLQAVDSINSIRAGWTLDNLRTTLMSHPFYKMDGDETWLLCYAAREHLGNWITLKNKSPYTRAYEFTNSYGSREHVVIECPTNPPIYLRSIYGNKNKIRILFVFDSLPSFF